MEGIVNDKVAISFGKRLRALRIKAKMTQEQLAEKAGFRVAVLSRLETGGRVPRWDTVLTLADALGVTPNDFRE